MRVCVDPQQAGKVGPRLTRHVDTDEQWPDLLGALFQLSQSEDAGQRETAFRIFSATPGIIEAQHQDTVLGAFTKGFKDNEDQVIQIEA